ncbi:GIY-YIG nuclease family protein [Chengkuizengella axinellae]|uniref:GIY-YIG nuclease family protein n=1 Tax=Chengkuizengella axinellae TaxID=3064388 RepID=A0ABT9IZD5_9BACL|nr:GIY-YIG nuclease family protein [Chengkuizengella sp. 2205SS18-9]MDP5274154.1 GIY-YIG nuclease family protein [Chengkuizengella sp. 2205SS18-9]
MVFIFYVYILKCSDNTLYTGYTNDIERRVAVHNQGKASKYTRGRLPVEVVYYEECNTKSDALKREIEIKKLTKAEKLRLIHLS